MSPPPSVRQISRDTLGEVPGWMDRFLGPFNRAFGQIADLFSGNITEGENCASQWLTLPVAEGTAPGVVAIDLRGRIAKGVFPARVEVLGTGSTPGSSPTGPVAVEWTPTTKEGKPAINVTRVWGLASGSRAALTLLVKAE